MSTRIAINGFGRIGRLFFRQVLEHKNLEVVAINDLGDPENLAYLLSFDTVYGRLDQEVSVQGNVLVVGKHKIQLLQEKDPSKLPWGQLKVDVAVECTGAFESFAQSRMHLVAGAKRVVVSAPAKDEDGEDARTVLVGVNEEDAKKCVVCSNGSCTTNSIAVVMAVLEEKIGVAKAVLNTVHGYTATQNLVDGSVRGHDVRRGRAAAQNIVPSSTGAAIATTRVIPSLKGKFDGIALRVPVPAGSIADITFVAKRATTPEEVNAVLEQASKESRWKGIFRVEQKPIVSSDVLGEPYSAIVDALSTRVVDGDLVKVLAWYDNEWGYASTLVKHVEMLGNTI